MDLEQKLIKWFNNKIDYFENQCNNDSDHMIKLIRSNEFQFKCNNIWKQLQPLRALIYDTLNVQNQQTHHHHHRLIGLK
ncbi:hypothetical protein DERP_008012 [Dermatophagoides pteronyssinus]|uniref:Uncharacterized protein n=1 Tax=Dermatophagoides pteronyssinus TaxID=6956 RepID=A0ABQ8IT89_DERPT|nr:hypothetical protein DERP_008012 [Dermatophagoides pteronyssinus]